jgi:lysophospholipase L1-like esterase
VIVQAGINDLKVIGALPGRRDEIVSDCKANLRAIVRRAKECGAAVIVSTIFPTGDVQMEQRLIWSPEIDKAVVEVNADVQAMAADRVVVLDAWKILEDRGRLRREYGIDTLHLSRRGYEALNAELERILRSL